MTRPDRNVTVRPPRVPIIRLMTRAPARRLATATLSIALACAAGLACQSAPTRKSAAEEAIAKTNVARERTARAADLIDRHKYAEAEALLLQAIDADPTYGPAHNDLGLIYEWLDRPADAANEYRTAARLMPRRPEPRNNLGLVLEQGGRFTDALRYYEQAIDLEPENAVYVGNAARCRIRAGLEDQVTWDLLQRLLRLDNRPDWLAWARLTLLRWHNPPAPTAPAPTTQPLP